MSLLTVSNPKTRKGESLGYLTAILHLAPARLASAPGSPVNVCPMATAGCSAACLNTAGRGGIFPSIQEARVRKTRAFFADRAGFMLELEREIAALVRRAARLELTPAVRLNGTSDIRFESVPAGDAPNLMARFPDVQFYDYTKLPNRKNVPDNYHLTFSLAEGARSWKHHLEAIDRGLNVAVVLRDPSAPHRRALEFPPAWNGRPLVSGDESDLRFLDPVAPDGRGLYVGLRAKGRAILDTSGFVHDLTKEA
jgi:hypothetical protein